LFIKEIKNIVMILRKIDVHEAKDIGNKLGILWTEVDLNEFTMGLNVELEHGLRYPETNITNDDELMTGKIAWAHLKEFPDYYTRLAKMEKSAEEYWKLKLLV
jgi:hypothetical protein